MDKKDLIKTVKQMLENTDEETLNNLAYDAIHEVRHKLKELQEAIHKNQATLMMLDFACVIGISVMGPVNIADLEERTDQFPGLMLTRTIVGDTASCKAAVTVLANQIQRLDKDKEVDNG